MAEIAPTVEILSNRTTKVTWANLQTGDTGSWVNALNLQDKSVHIEGDTITTIAFQGSNENSKANPRSVKDVDGTTISAAGTHTIKEYVHFVRPVVTTGANVTFTLFGR